MDQEKVIKEVIDLIGKSLDISSEEIRGDIRLYGGRFGVSSLELVSLIVKLEEKFGIEFPDEFFNNDLVIDDIIQWLIDRQ